MIFWRDMNRLNWSLVMVAYQTSDDHYKYIAEEYDYDYYEEDDYSNEEYYAENKTMLIHTYPFWVGASDNIAYRCGAYAQCIVCSVIVLLLL